MAISLKRIGALMLAALLCIVACSVGFGRVEAAATLFSDDFRSDTLSGWTAPSVGTVQNGQYTSLYDGANFVRNGVGQRSYAVSATVSVAVARAQNGFQTGGTASTENPANVPLAETLRTPGQPSA